MEIKTKYNIGDNLYYISNKFVVKRGTVRGIRYTVATEFIPKKGYYGSKARIPIPYRSGMKALI